MEGVIGEYLNEVFVPFGWFNDYMDAQEAMRYVGTGVLMEAKRGMVIE